MRDKVNRSHMGSRGVNNSSHRPKGGGAKTHQRSQYNAPTNNNEHYSSIMHLRKSFLSERRKRENSSDSNKIKYSASEESNNS